VVARFVEDLWIACPDLQGGERLILKAPAANAGVVAVPAHQPIGVIGKAFPCGGQVEIEIRATAVNGGLIMHEHSHFIGEIQIEARMRKSMETHRIHIAVLEHLIPGPGMPGGHMCNAEEMAQLDIHAQRFAIQGEPLILIEPELPPPEAGHAPVNHRVAGLHLHQQTVKIRLVGRPFLQLIAHWLRQPGQVGCTRFKPHGGGGRKRNHRILAKSTAAFRGR